MAPLGNKNRELSQFGQFVLVTDSTRSVGIATTALPRIGIGTTNPTSKLHVNGDVLITGVTTFSSRIVPSTGNAVNNGIEWMSDPGGGSGDRAFIKYYSETGENTRLHIGIQNDVDDDIYFESSTSNFTGSVNINGNTTLSGITTVGLGTTSNPVGNSQLSFELTSNTNLRIKVKDSSGVIRTANITLS